MMKIESINAANSQPNFEGRVSKKTIRRINKYTKIIINKEIEAAKHGKRAINEQFIRDTATTKDIFIKIITSFAEKLHPDSVIHLKEKGRPNLKYVGLIVKNKNLKPFELMGTNFRSYSKLKKSEKIEEVFKNIKEFIYDFVPSAKKAKAVETDMFSNLLLDIDGYLSNGPRFMLPKKAKKTDKLAKEFGYPPDCAKMLEHSRNSYHPNISYSAEKTINNILQKERTSGVLSSNPKEPVSWEKYLKILKLQDKKIETKNKEIIEKLKQEKVLK